MAKVVDIDYEESPLDADPFQLLEEHWEEPPETSDWFNLWINWKCNVKGIQNFEICQGKSSLIPFLFWRFLDIFSSHDQSRNMILIIHYHNFWLFPHNEGTMLSLAPALFLINIGTAFQVWKCFTLKHWCKYLRKQRLFCTLKYLKIFHCN